MMVRMATAAALALALGVLVPGARPALAADLNPVEAAVGQQLAAAEVQYEGRAYADAVEALAPALAPDVFETLSDAEQYEVLGLYARALYRLGAFDDAHAAFVDLTANPDATAADWALRAETAQRIGDAEDADLAQSQLEDAAADDDDDAGVSIAA